MKTVYHKLVRDNIPDIIARQGKEPIFSALSEEDYRICLRQKLQEEVQEYLESEEMGEIADIFEVLYAILDARHISPAEIERIRAEKASRSGAFEKRILLEAIEDGR